MEFKKIDKKNIWKVCALCVEEEQQSFVATNTESILEAYVTITNGGNAFPFAVYEGNVLVGFVMFGYEREEQEGGVKIAQYNYSIWRLMIDKKYQGKGYGKKALQTALAYLKTYPCGEAQYVWLSYEKDNIGAQTLYRSMGFEETGEICDNEIVAVRNL